MQQHRVFSESVAVAIVLTAVSYLVGVYFDWMDDVPWLEVASVFTSYSCTYLCVKESRLNFPIGILSVVLLSIVFYNAQLYSSMILSLYLVPMLLVGWWQWHPNGQLTVTRVTKRNMFSIVAWSSLTYAIVKWATDYAGGILTQFDSAILVLSIVAQCLLIRKYIETWMVWAVVNVLAIYTYFQAETYMVALQYVFFLGNTVYGFMTWRRSCYATAI